MNELVSKYGDKLVVLAFPSNQFGHQENSKGEEILRSLRHVRPGDGFEPLCTMMEKVDVNGKGSHPVFQFLREKMPYPSDDGVSLLKDPRFFIWDPVTRTDIAWNFEKFLITPDGKPFRRYSKQFQTINLQHDIDSLILDFKV